MEQQDTWASLSVGPVAIRPLEIHKPDLRRVVVLSPCTFRLCWWIVFLYHIFNACFALICGAAHRVLAIPAVYQSTWMLAIPRTTLSIAAWCYLTVALVHVYSVVLNLWQSVKQRKLAFRFDSGHMKSGDQTFWQPTLFARVSAAVVAPLQPVMTTWDRLFGVSGMFGPQGRYFEVVFHSQLLVDIAAQIYQAYVISWSVPRESVNGALVIMIMMYCIKTPLIDYFLRHSPAQCRLVNLIVDVVLDFGIGVVIPIWVLLPTVRDFDMALGRFPQKFTYSDTWVTNMMSEGRVVLVTSAADCVASMIPHVMSLIAIGSIKDILRCASASVDMSDSIVVALGPTEVPSLRILQSVLSWKDQVRVAPFPKMRRRLIQIVKSKRTVSWMDALTILIAIATCLLHILARTGIDKSVTSCDIRVNAWMATRYPCSVVQVNCYRLGISGEHDAIESVLSKFERSMLTRLIFSHCPELHVPPIITEFNNLRAFEVYNSTIVQWDEDAAITRKKQPRVVHLLLIKTAITTTFPSCVGCLPSGLLHGELPEDLNLVINQCNMSAFPSNIGELWGEGKVRWITFWIDYTSLRELPPSFSSLHLVKLSLVGSQLQQLPDDLLSGDTKHLTMLRLSKNPLIKLPRDLTDKAALVHLFAEETQVAELPDWVNEWSDTRKAMGKRRVVSFADSPACCFTSASDPVFEAGSREEWACATAAAENCQVVDPVLREDFRLDLVQAQRPL